MCVLVEDGGRDNKCKCPGGQRYQIPWSYKQKPSFGCQEQKLDPLYEQQAQLPKEPSLQPCVRSLTSLAMGKERELVKGAG